MAGKRTKPIPTEMWPVFYRCMWQLAESGSYEYEGAVHGVAPDDRRDLYLIARRHGLCVLLSTFCALRFSELRRLRINDIEKGSVFVTRSKGSLSDWYQVSDRLLRLWALWHVAWCADRSIESALVFPSRRGGYLNIRAFNNSLGLYLSPFGLSITSHVFRSTSCIIALEQSQSLLTVQQQLGHRRASTTDQYISKVTPRSFRLEVPE